MKIIAPLKAKEEVAIFVLRQVRIRLQERGGVHGAGGEGIGCCVSTRTRTIAPTNNGIVFNAESQSAQRIFSIIVLCCSFSAIAIKPLRSLRLCVKINMIYCRLYEYFN